MGLSVEGDAMPMALWCFGIAVFVKMCRQHNIKNEINMLILPFVFAHILIGNLEHCAIYLLFIN